MGDPHPSSPLFQPFSHSLPSVTLILCSFSNMASPSKKAKCDDPLNSDSPQVSSLSERVLQTMGEGAMLNYLLSCPNGGNAVEVLKKFCTESGFEFIFRYLLSLPYSHRHRMVIKTVLDSRFKDITIDELHEIGKEFIPVKSALVNVGDERVAKMGPLTNLDTGQWDTSEWFFRILHSRRMEGEPMLLFDIPLSIYTRARLHFETE